jgi:hypothetical protein
VHITAAFGFLIWLAKNPGIDPRSRNRAIDGMAAALDLHALERMLTHGVCWRCHAHLVRSGPIKGDGDPRSPRLVRARGFRKGINRVRTDILAARRDFGNKASRL